MAVQSYSSTVLLETVALNVVDDQGNVFQARALLDSASMSNFMSKKLAKLLSNRQIKVDVTVAGIGQSMKKMKRSVTTTIQSRVSSFATKLEFLIIDKPSADLPTVPVQISTMKIPNVHLADPQYCVPSEIDVVIGGEAYWELHTGKKFHLGPGLPHMIETMFGWTFSGPTCVDSSGPKACLLSTNDDSLDATLQRFWEIEAIPVQSTHSAVERTCEELYEKTTTQDSAGRYVVRLPITDDPEVTLGDSRSISERRFLGLERRLERNSEVKTAYHQFMAEYERLGHMKRLNEPVDRSIQHCYLPHHPVFKLSSTTTKTRVVFDASCKTASGHSLNDLLLVGPVVQQDLLSLVMRFRTHAVALVGDIEKMYRQILVHPDDQPLQLILWRTDPGETIATYQLQTVTYGTACAPYLATKTLQRLAKDAGQRFPAAAEPVKDDFYVDDFLSGAPDVQTALQLRREVSAMLESAGLPIKKWASNSIEVLEDVPPADQAIQPWHDLQDEQSVSTLGLVWEPRSDTFGFKVQLPLPAAVLTKRTIMSYVARIFDPLGLAGPTVAKAKLFMQCLWALKSTDGGRFDWDQPLPARLQQEWKEFHNTIDLLRQVRVPRFVSVQGAVSIELHFFADASEKAYGTCCYVRAQSSQQVTVQLLASKSKVAPLAARHTIARLELCAAHLSTQLYKKVMAALKLPCAAYFWSDSTTTLQWIRSPPGRWSTFVANRVTHVQLATSVENWRHVAGTDNPADDISRGLSAIDLLNSERWWHGPSWLALPPESWPLGAVSTVESTEVTRESRKTPIVAMTTTQTSFNEELFSRFSSYSKLRRITAYWLRYLQTLRDRAIFHRNNPTVYASLIRQNITSTRTQPPNTDELQSAERVLCRLAQRQSFLEERNDLSAGDHVSKSSLLKWLSPQVDQFQLIRVGGRLSNAALPDSAKHPIVLSAKHPLANLLASHYHKMLLHAGPQLMLSTLRQKFWILGGRNLVRRIFHQCHVCFRKRPQLIQQAVADLPTSRVTPTRPFSISGVDYCGPFYVKSEVRKRGPAKVYVAIFVCFSTRAVHIELVSDLTTASFLSALRRFIAERGRPAEIHSDNATTFKGASHALHHLFQMFKTDQAARDNIFAWCANNEIRWKFIPPRAPHFGGLWEAAVKSAKFHLLKELGNHSITREDLVTLLAQVQMMLNSRPLTPLPSQPQDLEALTPGHFLVGTNLQAIVEPNLKDIPDNRLDHWELTQKRFQGIWARWYPEYLQQLQARATKGRRTPTEIQIGRIVIIKDDDLPPVQWPLGKIIQTHPGKDGVVRVVTLKTASSDHVVRPVARLAFLPLPDDDQPRDATRDQ